MSTDAKKHTSIAAGEAPSRAALAAAIFSIDDVIPVANATEAGQVATAVAAAGQVLASNPVTVSRADARGLHRIEYSYDGTNWIPASGLLAFTSTGTRDSFTTTYSSLLTPNDRCVVNSTDLYSWTGSMWVPAGTTFPHFAYARTTAFNFTPTLATLTWDASPVEGSLTGFTVASGVFTCTFPGVYLINSEVTAGAAITGNIQLQKNGTAFKVNNQINSSSGNQSFLIADTIRLAVGDTIQCQIQATGTVGGIATASQTRITFDMLHA